MRSSAKTPRAYVDSLPQERRLAVGKLRRVIKKNLPKGFAEVMGYGMLGYVVPLRLYPAGYHCTPGEPLPFLSIASQKNFVALYHLGIFAEPKLLSWSKREFPHHSSARLDMGKSCIRFKRTDQIPYDLLGQLASQMTPEEWIQLYEKAVKPRGAR